MKKVKEPGYVKITPFGKPIKTTALKNISELQKKLDEMTKILDAIGGVGKRVNAVDLTKRFLQIETRVTDTFACMLEKEVEPFTVSYNAIMRRVYREQLTSLDGPYDEENLGGTHEYTRES